MLKSMTGYGRFEGTKNGRHIVLEMRAVNHKFFESSLRITRGYMFLEDKLKNHLQKRISRGKVDLFLQIETAESADISISVNHGLVEQYMKAFQEINEQHKLEDRVTLSHLTRYPDVFVISKAQEDEEQVWDDIREAADTAIDSFIRMRETEGMRLREDILKKLDCIMLEIAKIEKNSPETVKLYRERLLEKIAGVLEDNRFDEQRVLTEVAIMADKLAVDEEIVRLKSHFEQFKNLLEQDTPVGRKLDFLLQEMNREINTIGSKAMNSDIQHLVVNVKAEIEKIREQVQNIE